MSAQLPMSGSITVEQYLSYEAPEGIRDELIDGEIILSPSPKPRHATLIMRLSNLLQQALEDSDFEVRLDTSIRLKDSRSMPRPDILVMDQTRWDAAEEADVYPPVPQLAIEIFSPANSKKAFARKIEIYLKNGALAVWVLHPDSKTIVVHTSEGRLEVRESNSVSFPPSLPSVLIPVAKVFAPRRASKKS